MDDMGQIEINSLSLILTLPERQAGVTVSESPTSTSCDLENGGATGSTGVLKPGLHAEDPVFLVNPAGNKTILAADRGG